MKLFVGLGNPGAEYERNRHNVGFMVLDHIASRENVPTWKRKFQGLMADIKLSGERVILLKPQTYMNESGRSVGEAARFLKIPTCDIIVFHDEIDLPPAKLKIKTGGGNAGHNGLKSISAHVGNDYVRVRIGVGHPGDRALVSNYVLNNFAKSDQVWLEPLLEEISNAAGRLATGDHARFLNNIARALAPEKKTKPKKDRPPAGQPGKSASTSAKSAAINKKPDSAPRTSLSESLQKWLKGSNDKN